MTLLFFGGSIYSHTQSGIFFNDLSSDESRKLFKTFVQKWNDGLLDKVLLHEL